MKEAAATVLLFAAVSLAPAQQPGWIEGVAFNKLTKAPVAGVTVRVKAVSEPGTQYEAVTDANGAYRIGNLAAGEYSPSFDAPAGFYPPDPVELALKRTRIQVADHAATFDVEITPASAIQGRLLDPDGLPVARATIFAVPITGIRLAAAKTDAEGRFSIPVAPGKYRLEARPASHEWVPTFYPDVADPSSAEPVQVREGADAGGFVIRLRAPAQARVRGVVHGGAGEPVPGVSIALGSLAGVIEQLAKVKSDEKGAFEFASVPPGEWLIAATATRGGVDWRGKTTATMTTRDLEGVDVRIDPPFLLNVELEGPPQERRNSLRFELRSAFGSTSDLYATERNGRAHFDAVYPGMYRVGVNGLVPGYHLQSILLGTAEIIGQPVRLGPGSPPLHVVYAPGGARITGDVEAGVGAKVILLWADRDHSVPGTDVITICNAGGRFSMNDLRPGDWYALAFTGLGNGMSIATLRQRVFDGGLWRQAESVHLRDGETTAAKLKASPWLE